MNRHWLLNKTNPEFIQYLSNRTSISPILVQVLINRGIRDEMAIKGFLSPSLDSFHDPFLLPDMEMAVRRLKLAVHNKETVLVHGDYDADGITSTAILVSALNKLGLKTHYHIPNRIKEGYGISEVGIQKAKSCGAHLIITADCGISSENEVMKARSLGMDVIITDHHEPPEKLPKAIAVINPHRKDSKYPYKYLAGVGVVFKLIQAIFHNNEPNAYLDMVALGTIADSVPLTGENRIFVSFGLKEINMGECRPGIMSLKKVSAIEGDVTSGRLSFTIIPRINSAGRLDDANEVVELFLTDDVAKTEKIAGLLEEQNRKRQKIEGEVLQSALIMISPQQIGNTIVLSSHDWHPGVIGIVASRLVERYYRPVFLFSVKDSVAKGSARSIPPFHLYNAIAESSELLIGFGGHKQAAGLKIAVNNLQAFKEQMDRIFERDLTKEDMVPVLEIDAAVHFSDLNFDLVKELSLLEPFGFSNREPVLGAKSIEIMNHRVVRSNHLKMQLRQDRINIDTIGFNMADQVAKIERASKLDIVFIPSINEWNGSKSLQLSLKAMRANNM